MKEWKTLQECFEENNKEFPFLILWKIEEDSNDRSPFLERLIVKRISKDNWLHCNKGVPYYSGLDSNFKLVK